MSESQKIMCVIGTRPEAIKMAPIILALKKEPWVEVQVLATAQHREMLDQVLLFFGIEPDIDLNIMLPDQSLTQLTGRLLLQLDDVLMTQKPDAVLIQGDTTTVMTVALSCFYHNIPVGHVEAGLRTWDMRNPFPEEANRVITSKLARWHFAPTEGSKLNLMNEGVDDKSIFVTGNTVIDALLATAEKNHEIDFGVHSDSRMILVTSHRRENFGEPFGNICKALRELALANPKVWFLYPVHPNPNVKNIAYSVLGKVPNFILCEPLEYAPFVSVMKRSYLILTDSGGVQEEAPALGIPVLVLREETERPEAVDEGVVKLVGSDPEAIITETQRLLDDHFAYAKMARGSSPYGDGQSSSRIVSVLKDYFV